MRIRTAVASILLIPGLFAQSSNAGFTSHRDSGQERLL
jgi:hypothetical protein